MGSITEFKNSAGELTKVVFKPSADRIAKLKFIGFYKYELQIHGVSFGVIAGPAEIKFYNLLHQLYDLLVKSRSTGGVFKSQEMTAQFAVLAMINNIDLTPWRTWNDYDIYLPEWNTLDMSNLRNGFQIVPVGDDHQANKPRIHVNYS
jgi:hypothetical protein